MLTAQPAPSSSYKVVQSAQQSAGTVVSYAVTGASYAAEYIWNVAVIGTGVIVLCSPGLVASAAAGGAVMMGNSMCIPADVMKLKAPELGAKAYEETKELRCPNLDELSGNLRKVSQCYKDKGEDEKAVDVLHAMTTSKPFFQCLSKDESAKVLKMKGQFSGAW